ncbi:hypothetical protein DRE_01041 [Drechslerella stenobrocha 248]|uniref:Uncharacterized protein n=1 Tax=Drechslerella stenobrocha 248 TaxID=1043628 RepID=W7HXY3_9PEZI|nr:hypothetical protein DRE_01041 [Drechslerella stenobrocha 248]
MAAAALQMPPSLPQDIHAAAFMSHPRPFPKPRQPKLAIPPTPMRLHTDTKATEVKAADADFASRNANASSPILPTTPKLRRKRRSFADSTGIAPEITAKRRRIGKDPKLGAQSPEKSGEEQEGSTRESYPDPRWMNQPRKYLHLRDHRYKYISKITNKLLDDVEWHDKAKEYQEIQQKKTGTWMSLNQHLYHKQKPLKDCIPPSVNPLELIIDLVLKHGAASREDRNQEPSIAGCFLRLTGKLVNNEPLAKSIEQELVDTIASRERIVADDISTQQASPVTSAAAGPLDQPISPTTLLPGSPGLDLASGSLPPAPTPPPVSPIAPRTKAQDRDTLASPLHRTPSGSGPQPARPSQHFGPPTTISNGISGSTVQDTPSLYDLSSGFSGNMPTYGLSARIGPNGINPTYVDLAASPTLPISTSPLTHTPGLQYFPRLAPRTRSPLGYNHVSAAATTANYIPPHWTTFNDQPPLYSPQDRTGDSTVLPPESYTSSSTRDSVGPEYHTPRDQTQTGAAGLWYYESQHQHQQQSQQQQSQQQPIGDLGVLALEGVMDNSKVQELFEFDSLNWPM